MTFAYDAVREKCANAHFFLMETKKYLYIGIEQFLLDENSMNI